MRIIIIISLHFIMYCKDNTSAYYTTQNEGNIVLRQLYLPYQIISTRHRVGIGLSKQNIKEIASSNKGSLNPTRHTVGVES